eukprot:CAMPEP_0170263378 /NCGR_PEP_ID=MMETSP0116_2-20130129/31575_1 /TAXON_ID=400756 /ORGANISM="Durinskia baltica, Strain CSIRO CS-38" /LENGTH=158 /DNA_ID=CAMNT_0010514453 /DNA_START=31 /DNA_END=504 /DNA_ORIENTATION=-
MHLQAAMSRVNDELSSSPQLLEDGRRKDARTTHSLRFPRVAVLQEPSSDEPTAKPSTACTGSTASTAGTDGDLADQVEELRLQNAVLRKSLAMLQQSVVDSMKGDKGQFMGNGIFKKGGASAGGPPRSSVSPMPPSMPAADDAELESLRAALAEKRTA